MPAVGLDVEGAGWARGPGSADGGGRGRVLREGHSPAVSESGDDTEANIRVGSRVQEMPALGVVAIGARIPG